MFNIVGSLIYKTLGYSSSEPVLPATAQGTEKSLRQAVKEKILDHVKASLSEFDVNSELDVKKLLPTTTRELFKDIFLMDESSVDNFSLEVKKALIDYLIKRKDFDSQAIFIDGKTLTELLQDADKRNSTTLVAYLFEQLNQKSAPKNDKSKEDDSHEITLATNCSHTNPSSETNLSQKDNSETRTLTVSSVQKKNKSSGYASASAAGLFIPDLEDNSSENKTSLRRQALQNLSGSLSNQTISQVPSLENISNTPAPSIALQPMAILLVEDSSLGKGLSKTLERKLGPNAQIFWVRNHLDALHAMQGKPFKASQLSNDKSTKEPVLYGATTTKFNLIILDFNLDAQFAQLKLTHPDENLRSGFDVTQEAYSGTEKSARPIILTHTDTSEKLGISDGKLNKPFDFSDLHQMLYDIMGAEWIAKPSE